MNDRATATQSLALEKAGRLVSTAQSDAHRDARAELTEELHAGAIQRISAVSVAIASKSMNDQDLDRCGVELRGALADIRDLLLPAPGAAARDASTLHEELCAHVADTSSAVSVSVVWPEELAFSDLQEPRLKTFVAEALRNVDRHASAKSISIIFGSSAGGVFAAIENDGCLDANSSATPGIGLRLIEHETSAHGGRVEYGPLEGSRWRVTLELPTAA